MWKPTNNNFYSIAHDMCHLHVLEKTLFDMFELLNEINKLTFTYYF